MSPQATRVLYSTILLVVSIGMLPAASAVTLPANYSAKVLSQGDLTCPSAEEQEDSVAEIDQEIKTILQQAVLPNLQCPGITEYNPASSCLEIAECDPSLGSGYYWITNDTQVYCDMDREECGTSGWTRVTLLNTTDLSQDCPSAWNEISAPVRACGKLTDGAGCDSVVFNTNGIQYSRVLGRVSGYGYGTADGFCRGLHDYNIESYYLDGVSITRGNPREHVWSFGGKPSANTCCPCDLTPAPVVEVPSFVGEDYFCDGFVGSSGDPLWNGEGCDSDPSPCCSHNNPPWFCKQLTHATTDGIEVRICDDESLTNENFSIELIEIYVQ